MAAVAAHHETGSIAAPDAGYPDASTSRYGMDFFIYKISETGKPISVYAMDLTSSDGLTNRSSENVYPYGNPTGIDGFEKSGAPDMIAVCGEFMGKLKFPRANGTTLVELVNRKYSHWDSFVAKIDMANKSAVWVTGEGLEGRGYANSVVTTAAGDVITATQGRNGTTGVYNSANLTKFDGTTGALVWQKNFGGEFYFRGSKPLVASGEKVYLSARFLGKDSTAFAPAQALTTSCGEGEERSSVVAEFDVWPPAMAPSQSGSLCSGAATGRRPPSWKATAFTSTDGTGRAWSYRTILRQLRPNATCPVPWAPSWSSSARLTASACGPWTPGPAPNPGWSPTPTPCGSRLILAARSALMKTTRLAAQEVTT